MTRGPVVRPVPAPAAAQSVVLDPVSASIEAAAEPNSWDDVLSNVGGDDARVHVYAEPDRGQGGAAFCFAIHRDECDWTDLLERIRAEYGGGLYSFRVKQGGKWYGGRRLRIHGRPRDAAAPPAGALVPSADPVLQMQLRMMETNQKFLTDMALKLAGQGGGTSITDVIAAAKLLAGDAPRRDPIEEIFKLEKLRGLLAGSSGGGGGDDEHAVGATTADLIIQSLRTFGEPLAKLLAGAGAPPDEGAPPAPGAPARVVNKPQPNPAPIAGPPRPKAPPAPPDPMRLLLGLMLRGAENESPPDAYAVLALDAIGDEGAAALLAMPDALDRLIAIEPKAEAHRAWIGQVLEAARAMLAPDPDEPGDLTSGEGDSNGGADDSGPMH